MHTGDWTKDRQASQLYTKDSWEHLQAGNVQPINQLMFMESKTDQVTLDFEPISIIPILGREEACWLLWVCHRPRVFWKHSKKPQLLILPLKIIHFKGGEYVPCFISGQTASGLPHGETHNMIQLLIFSHLKWTSPSGWWWSGSAFPGASVRWVRWKRSNWLRFDVSHAVWLGRQGGGGRAIRTT